MVPSVVVHLPAATLGQGVSPLGGRMVEVRRKLRQRLDRQSTRVSVLLPFSSSFLLFASFCLLASSVARASTLSSFLCFAASLFWAIHRCIVVARLARAASLLAVTLIFSSSVSTRGGVGFGLVSAGHWSAA